MYFPPACPQGSTTGADPGALHGLSVSVDEWWGNAHVCKMLLTLIAVILRTGKSMDIHGPKLFWENILCLWVLAVRLAKACFVGMREVASYWCGWDGAIIVWVPWICQAIVTPNGASLRPPEARLPRSTFLSGRPQLTRPIVGTGAACSSLACSILEAVDNTVKGIAANWDAAGVKVDMTPFKC